MITPFRWTQLLLVAGLLLLAGRPPAVVAEPFDTSPASDSISSGFADGTIETRRLFVPADRPELWPTGERPFLLVDEARLDDLLSQPPRETPAARELTLAARLSDDGRLVGEGRLRVDADSPVFLPWPRSPLTIADARWATGGRAAIGWWPRPNGDHAHGVVVPRGGELTFRFRSPPVAWEGSQAEVLIAAPLAMRRAIEIQTPAWMAVRGGVFEKRRWRVEAPPGAELRLSLQDTRQTAGRVDEPPTVVEHTRIQVDPEGARLHAELKLTAERRLPTRVRVTLPAGVVLEGAEFEGESLTVPAEGANNPTGLANRAVENPVELTLPVGLSRRSGRLVLRAAIATRHNAEWRAPRPRIAGARWTEGVLRVDFADRVSLIDIPSERGVTPIAAGSSLAYRLLTPDASVSLRHRLAANSATASVTRDCQLGPDTDETTVALRVESITGSTPTSIVLQVIGRWQPDSVETVPEGIVDRWSVGVDGTDRLLRLSLDDGVTADDLLGAEITVRTLRRRSRRSSAGTTLLSLGALRVRSMSVGSDRLGVRGWGGLPLVASQFATDRVLSTAAESPAAPPTTVDIDRFGDSGFERVLIDLTGMRFADRAAGRLLVAGTRVDFTADTAVRVAEAVGERNDQRRAIAYDAQTRFGAAVTDSSGVTVQFDSPLPEDARWA
ncbi:MAG: hypothetical protein AAGG46_05450, partial [Planctomycetota bacterium]